MVCLFLADGVQSSNKSEAAYKTCQERIAREEKEAGNTEVAFIAQDAMEQRWKKEAAGTSMCSIKSTVSYLFIRAVDLGRLNCFNTSAWHICCVDTEWKETVHMNMRAVKCHAVITDLAR